MSHSLHYFVNLLTIYRCHTETLKYMFVFRYPAILMSSEDNMLPLVNLVTKLSKLLTLL